MEDLPIEPGICATRIRCYTEGAIQRPATCFPSRRGKGTVYKSTSSLHCIRNGRGEQMPSPTNQRELCKSCDQLPQGSTSRSRSGTFVSSVRIALANPEPARKLSLPPPVPHRRDSSNVEPSSSSQQSSQLPRNDARTSLDPPVECQETEAPSIHQGETGLPWEINDDFPHVPVLERIKEFERQTGTPNSRSSSPGRWKHKAKTNCNKSSGSVPSMSQRSSAVEKVTVRNSRNSSPAMLHLHVQAEMLGLGKQLKSRAEEQASDRDSSKTVQTSDLTPSSIKSQTAFPEVAIPEQKPLVKFKDAQTETVRETEDSGIADPLSEKGSTETVVLGKFLTNSQSGNKHIVSSDAVSVERKFQDENIDCKFQNRPSSEEVLGTNNSIESSTPEVVLDPQETQSKPTCHSSSSDTTENVTLHDPTAQCEEPSMDNMMLVRATDACIILDPGFLGKADVQDSTASDHKPEDCLENSVHNEGFVLNYLSGDTQDPALEEGIQYSSAISETNEVNFEASEACGKLLNDASNDCHPATEFEVPEIEARSSLNETPDNQCNIPDLSECVTSQMDHCQPDDTLEEPLPVEPLIDEIFQARVCMDTDVYSQRCSQQLGECGSDSAVSQSACVVEGLAVEEGSSPCLSDCYSRSICSSDDESQTTDLHSDATVDPRLVESSNCSTLTCTQPHSDISNKDVNPEVCSDLDSNFVNREVKESSINAQSENVGSPDIVFEKPEEPRDFVSEKDSEESSSSSTSESDTPDDLDCIREVLASSHVPDLPSSLGACGGQPSPSTSVNPDDSAEFARHLSTLIRDQQEQNKDAGMSGDSKLSADQALFLSRVNLLLSRIHSQQSRAMPLSTQATLPSSIENRSSLAVPSVDQARSSPVVKAEDLQTEERQPIVQQRENKEVYAKPRKRSRKKKFINPDKVSHLRYLILQSPLVLSDGIESDSDESDVELNEFGEVKQDYPLGRLPDYIVAQIFSNLCTRDLAALKCACKDFKWLIERFDIKSTDSKWSESSQYREDPCMQCGKIRDPSGDVSLCRWHPKIYYKNGEIGRHHWTCCFASEEDAQGCETSLHDNKWSGSHSRLCKVPRSWRQYWRSYPMDG